MSDISIKETPITTPVKVAPTNIQAGPEPVHPALWRATAEKAPPAAAARMATPPRTDPNPARFHEAVVPCPRCVLAMLSV